MWTRTELKERGKTAFRANYWPCVLVSFILGLLTAGTTAATSFNSGSDSASDSTVNVTLNGSEVTLDSLSDAQTGMLIAGIAGLVLVIVAFALILNIFIFNPLKVGCYGFFRDNVATGNADLNVLKTGFQSYGRTFLTLFLRDLFLLLWTLLFLIPGIVKSYSYRMVPFIIRDNPELEPREVINRSRAMMNGHKWAAFKLDLSFLGWFLLSIITLGIVGVFWTNPYYNNTNAALYLRISGDIPADGTSGMSGTAGPSDRSGFSGKFTRPSRPEKPEWEL